MFEIIRMNYCVITELAESEISTGNVNLLGQCEANFTVYTMTGKTQLVHARDFYAHPGCKAPSRGPYLFRFFTQNLHNFAQYALC